MRLIAIEGVDGVGKATTARFVAEAIASRAQVLPTVAFPRYETDPWGPALRKSLRHGTLEQTEVLERALMFALDRSSWFRSLGAETAEFAICDRWIWSNYAYLAALASESKAAEMRAIETDFLGTPDAEVTVLVVHDDVAVLSDRIKDRAGEDPARAQDVYEAGATLQSRVHAAYLRVAEDNPGSWHIVHNTGSLGALREQVRALMSSLETG
jgi:dTMP kinase